MPRTTAAPAVMVEREPDGGAPARLCGIAVACREPAPCLIPSRSATSRGYTVACPCPVDWHAKPDNHALAAGNVSDALSVGGAAGMFQRSRRCRGRAASCAISIHADRLENPS